MHTLSVHLRWGISITSVGYLALDLGSHTKAKADTKKTER